MSAQGAIEGDELVPVDRKRNSAHRRRVPGIVNHDDPLDRGESAKRLFDARQAVVDLAAVEISVRCDEHTRLNLAEAVEHALDAEVGRTR